MWGQTGGPGLGQPVEQGSVRGTKQLLQDLWGTVRELNSSQQGMAGRWGAGETGTSLKEILPLKDKWVGAQAAWCCAGSFPPPSKPPGLLLAARTAPGSQTLLSSLPTGYHTTLQPERQRPWGTARGCSKGRQHSKRLWKPGFAGFKNTLEPRSRFPDKSRKWLMCNV